MQTITQNKTENTQDNYVRFAPALCSEARQLDWLQETIENMQHLRRDVLMFLFSFNLDLINKQTNKQKNTVSLSQFASMRCTQQHREERNIYTHCPLVFFTEKYFYYLLSFQKPTLNCLHHTK